MVEHSWWLKLLVADVVDHLSVEFYLCTTIPLVYFAARTLMSKQSHTNKA